MFVTISKRIKSARMSAGLTQQEVADRLGITGAGYSYIETGTNKVSIEYLVQRIYAPPVRHKRVCVSLYVENVTQTALYNIPFTQRDMLPMLACYRHMPTIWPFHRHIATHPADMDAVGTYRDAALDERRLAANRSLPCGLFTADACCGHPL